MATKASYKIPASLDATYMNMEIALQGKDGIGLRPLPARVILFWILSSFGLFYFVMSESSIIREGGILVTIFFVLDWIAMTFVLGSFDGTKRMQIQVVPSLLNYFVKSNRLIVTRRTSNANPFYRIANIVSINPKTGLVEYTDGTFAYWYRVVGSASILLFEDDKDAIISRVDSFYRKIGTDCEIIFMTTKEPQKIVRQKAHLIAQYKALEFNDPDMDRCVDEQYAILTDFVGKDFKSIHQYMVIKGDNREALSGINNVIRSEYENSALMLKQCTPMYEEDIYGALQFYSGERR